MSSALSPAIIVVDPVSSGIYLKNSIRGINAAVIAVFTLSQEELQAAGKHVALATKHDLCDVVIYAKTLQGVLTSLTDQPYTVLGVVAGSEPGVELADALAEHLGLPGNPCALTSARRNKYNMRLTVAEAGLSCVDFSHCETAQQAVDFANAHHYPVVVKAPKGAGAHHVYFCYSESEVITAFYRITQEPNVFGEQESFALVEEFIEGPQYAIETLGDGLDIVVTSIWAQSLTSTSQSGQVFQGARLVTSHAELQSLRAVCDYAIRVADALAIRRGPALVEVRNNPQRGPTLIEAGARLTGLDLPSVVEFCSNFSPFDATVDAFSNRSVRRPRDITFHKNAVLHMHPSQVTGIIERIGGLEDIQNLPSYFKHKLFVEPGEMLTPSTDLASIPLYVYFAHEDAGQIESDILRVFDLFHIAVQPKNRRVRMAFDGASNIERRMERRRP